MHQRNCTNGFNFSSTLFNWLLATSMHIQIIDFSDSIHLFAFIIMDIHFSISGFVSICRAKCEKTATLLVELNK